MSSEAVLRMLWLPFSPSLQRPLNVFDFAKNNNKIINNNLLKIILNVKVKSPKVQGHNSILLFLINKKKNLCTTGSRGSSGPTRRTCPGICGPSTRWRWSARRLGCCCCSSSSCSSACSASAASSRARSPAWGPAWPWSTARTCAFSGWTWSFPFFCYFII